MIRPVISCGRFLSANRWHVGCGAMGVLARHRRFAHNEAQRNDPNLVGTRSDFWRPSETGAVVWWEAGGRKVSGLPGATEDWFWGRCDGGSFATALMRGVPAEGTCRNLRAHDAGVACLRRFETVKLSGPAFVRLRRGKHGSAGRWSGYHAHKGAAAVARAKDSPQVQNFLT